MPNDLDIDFAIVPLNPVKFIDRKLGRFDGSLGVDLINAYQEHKCYFQKWQQDDVSYIQVLSKFDFITEVIDLESGLIAAALPVTMANTMLTGQTFNIYTIDLNFPVLALASGYYYLKTTYLGAAIEPTVLRSEPFHLAEEHPNTMLIEYRNSENNFSVVFFENLFFKFRVEGLIANFNPESDDLIYNDQKRNATLLDSIPYRSFTLFIGNQEGIPDWVADKANRIFSCDSITIDGEYYQKVDGSSWEIERAEEYAFIGISIEVMPVENRFLQRLKTQNGTVIDSSDFIIVQKIENYANLSAALTVQGKFRDRSLLEKICLIRTGVAFNIKIGITDGGVEIGEFLISELVTTLNINYLFTTEEALYITGISNLSFLSLIYKQLDQKPTVPASSGPGSVPRGATIIYDPLTADELAENFDIVSGLGRENTLWNGFAIADGRNGTKNRQALFPLGYKPGENTLHDTGGASEITLTIDQIPEHSHEYINSSGDDFRRSVGTGAKVFRTNQVTQTSKVGGGQAHSNMPPYIVSLWVTKIID
jgi:hypothetical protein